MKTLILSALVLFSTSLNNYRVTLKIFDTEAKRLVSAKVIIKQDGKSYEHFTKGIMQAEMSGIVDIYVIRCDTSHVRMDVKQNKTTYIAVKGCVL